MKTNKLTGAALNWAVAKCEHGNLFMEPYSTSWAQGGPIIEREVICILPHAFGGWLAKVHGAATRHEEGQTPLIAAMRCYVVSKLGDEINIPEELQ